MSRAYTPRPAYKAMRMREALESLIDAASNYVKPRRSTDARQVLIERLDAARAALAQSEAQPSVSAEPVAFIVPLSDDDIRRLTMSAEFPTGSLATAGERQLNAIANTIARAIEHIVVERIGGKMP